MMYLHRTSGERDVVQQYSSTGISNIFPFAYIRTNPDSKSLCALLQRPPLRPVTHAGPTARSRSRCGGARAMPPSRVCTRLVGWAVPTGHSTGTRSLGGRWIVVFALAPGLSCGVLYPGNAQAPRIPTLGQAHGEVRGEVEAPAPPAAGLGRVYRPSLRAETCCTHYTGGKRVQDGARAVPVGG